MSYLTSGMSIKAIIKMKSMHDDLKSLYSKHGLDLLDNIGRRNIVMSQAQELYFAQSLSDVYANVSVSGKSGQPDIIIGSLDKELECKLTSKGARGAINLQTDFLTLSRKKSLDYLYLITDHAFNKFVVLHFIDLNIDDFHPVRNAARGKVQMKKFEGMKKCNTLLGKATNLNEKHVTALIQKIKEEQTEKQLLKLTNSLAYWKTIPTRYAYELEAV
jgi:hypothetical protein